MHDREVEGVGKGVDGRKLRIYPKITRIRAKCDITNNEAGKLHIFPDKYYAKEGESSSTMLYCRRVVSSFQIHHILSNTSHNQEITSQQFACFFYSSGISSVKR